MAAEKAAPRYDPVLRKAAGGEVAKLRNTETYRRSHEPTDQQLRAGNYRKRKLEFQGLTIAVETEAGGVRRAVNKADGHEWSHWMPFAYGYILGSLGVDGDHVDCFLGTNPAAPTCFVVRERRWGAWKEYDEDKLMLGFDSEDDARRAFLLSYSDPRFLGPINPMPVAERRARLKASHGQMLKARVLFFKETQ